MSRVVVFAIALVALAGCSKRQGIARSPDQFKADVGKQIEARMPALEACRKEMSPGEKQAKVEVAIQIDQTFGNKVDAKGNGKLDTCVRDALADVKLDPVDQNMGLGSWVILYNGPEEKKSITLQK